MRIFKTKEFARFAKTVGLTDEELRAAVQEIEDGLVDADLGSSLYKKRIADDQQGKSGSYRTILAYRAGQKTFFIYGFPKNKRDNITKKEKEALKKFSKQYLKLSNEQLEVAKAADALFEITGEDNE